ncbi:protein kinase domain-containing protein [Candidatus Venteria ishoeyi]|uniref:Serine/threonine-protein kinase D n=1 Tax=Candidatus Venteria ishoeyi TaxID=1899563 RepID=A0A1H6FIW8_9GAMM|nr:protein kinase [Candidatus Venteria ishoeyi]SEH08995.1 Serine/threonine-protein kinase D [Candidatus Venteria ishoeyi]
MPITPHPQEHRNALPPGYQLEDYQIIKILGGGGFGITYLAEDVNLTTQFAIKEYFPNEFAVRESGHTVHPQSAKSAEFFDWGLVRFIEEAQTLGKFKHRNIVRVARFFRANNTAYIVMDYEEGETLSSMLAASGETATEEEIQTIIMPLLTGLEVVHDAGYYHRDIKPGNIYLRKNSYEPVLIDFGAARYALGSQSRTITSIVTPGYAALEQYGSKTSQGAYTDIYGLGAVLYRLISGHIPIEAAERAHALALKEPDPLQRAVNVGAGRYSENLLAGIDWALQLSERDRPQNVRDWKAVFEKKSTPEPIARVNTTPPHSQPSSTAQASTPLAQTASQPRSTAESAPKQTNYIVPALIGVIMLMGGVWFFSQQSSQPTAPAPQVIASPALVAAVDTEQQAELEQTRAALEQAKRKRIEAERQRLATEVALKRAEQQVVRERIARRETQKQQENWQPQQNRYIGYYNVVKVAANDVLNIRQTLNYRSQKLGAIPPDATCVPALDSDRSTKGGRWLQIQYNSTVGWVNGKYLQKNSNCY